MLTCDLLGEADGGLEGVEIDFVWVVWQRWLRGVGGFGDGRGRSYAR